MLDLRKRRCFMSPKRVLCFLLVTILFFGLIILTALVLPSPIKQLVRIEKKAAQSTKVTYQVERAANGDYYVISGKVNPASGRFIPIGKPEKIY